MTSATALPSGSETSPVSPNNRVSAVQAAAFAAQPKQSICAGVIEPREGQAVEWVAPDRLEQYSFPPADLALITRLRTT